MIMFGCESVCVCGVYAHGGDSIVLPRVSSAHNGATLVVLVLFGFMYESILLTILSWFCLTPSTGQLKYLIYCQAIVHVKKIMAAFIRQFWTRISPERIG